MKLKNISTNICLSVLAITTLMACSKKADSVIYEDKELGHYANLKVYNGTLSATRNYVYVGGVAHTGAALTYGNLFPSTGFYSKIYPGLVPLLIRDTLSTSTQTPINTNVNFVGGKYYTAFMYDTITSAKVLLQEDDLTQPPVGDTTCRIRIANLIYSTTAVPDIDIYSVKAGANIFTNRSRTSVSGFIPYPTGQTDTLIVRVAGTTTALTQLNGLVTSPRRLYTLVFRGRYQNTTGTNARILSAYSSF